jgi:response regulator RpfG family c-di-GMP phosphodiesterase
MLMNIDIIKNMGINGGHIRGDLFFAMITTENITEVATQHLSEIYFLKAAAGTNPRRFKIPAATKMLLTGYTSLDSAKYAINHQILDQYVYKPIGDYDHFVSLIENAVKTFHFREKRERAEKEIRQYVSELELTNERI